MTTKEIIAVEREVYEAVLRNSVRVNNLETENQQLKELLKECLNEIHELVEIQDNRSVTIYNFLSAELITKIDNAIGEK